MFENLYLPEMQINILNAAFNILNKEGFRKLTVRNICSRANCSTGNFYHYFKGKDDLMSFFINSQYEDIHMTLEVEAEKNGRLNSLERFVEIMTRMAASFERLGLDFIKEYYSPMNDTLNVAILRTTAGEHSVVDDLLFLLTDAAYNGMLQISCDDIRQGIEAIYKELNSVFFGVVFDWGLSNGSYELSRQVRRCIMIHINYYADEKYRMTVSGQI